MRNLFLFFCLSSATAWSQVTQGWTDFTVQKNVNSKFLWSVEGGPRFQANYGFYQFYTRSYLNYKLSNVFSASGGLSYFYSSSIAGRSHEIRPWEGLRFDFKLPGRIIFMHYFRVEERSLLRDTGNDFVFRFRYQTGLTFPIIQSVEKKMSGYIPVSFEVFEDLNKTKFINRNRWDFGAGYSFHKNKIEVHYLAQNGRSAREDDFDLTENIYRLRWMRSL